MNTETSPLIADDDDDILRQPLSQSIIVTPVKTQYSTSTTSPTIIIESSPPLDTSSKILNTNNNELNKNLILNSTQTSVQDTIQLNKTKNLTNENLNSDNQSKTLISSKQNIIIPNITLHSGASSSQPKRNVAVKNTSAHLNRNNHILSNTQITNSNLKSNSIGSQQATFRVNEDEIMNLDDKDQDSCGKSFFFSIFIK